MNCRLRSPGPPAGWRGADDIDMRNYTLWKPHLAAHDVAIIADKCGGIITLTAVPPLTGGDRFAICGKRTTTAQRAGAMTTDQKTGMCVRRIFARLASLFPLPNPRRWDKATVAPRSVSRLPLAALVALIAIGPALAVASPRLGLAPRVDFAVSAAVMVWAFRASRSCDRAAVLALLRWILHGFLLHVAFPHQITLPGSLVPAVIAVFGEPPLTAATLFFSPSARWQIEKSVRSASPRWESSAPCVRRSWLATFLFADHLLIFLSGIAISVLTTHTATAIYCALSALSAITVMISLCVNWRFLAYISILLCSLYPVVSITLHPDGISRFFIDMSFYISIAIYFMFSDHQRARIWRQVRT